MFIIFFLCFSFFSQSKEEKNKSFKDLKMKKRIWFIIFDSNRQKDYKFLFEFFVLFSVSLSNMSMCVATVVWRNVVKITFKNWIYVIFFIFRRFFIIVRNWITWGDWSVIWWSRLRITDNKLIQPDSVKENRYKIDV